MCLGPVIDLSKSPARHRRSLNRGVPTMHRVSRLFIALSLSVFSFATLAQEQVEPTRADVKYGPAQRNVLDFYQAPSDKPTPLIVNIHGGGFVAGDKRAGVNAASLKAMRDAGISFASINYRFVDGKDTIFPAP